MKLHKALKLRKKIEGEIASIKRNIQTKNCFIEGSVDTVKYSVDKMYAELLTKIQDLTGLKYAINEANREIQSKIYQMSEYKGLITFWQSVNVTEGVQPTYSNQAPQVLAVQYDELQRNNIIKGFQEHVDALQESLDTFNYTTEIPWDAYVPELDKEIPTVVVDNDKLGKFAQRVRTAKDDELTQEQTEQMSSK